MVIICLVPIARFLQMLTFSRKPRQLIKMAITPISHHMKVTLSFMPQKARQARQARLACPCNQRSWP